MEFQILLQEFLIHLEKFVPVASPQLSPPSFPEGVCPSRWLAVDLKPCELASLHSCVVSVVPNRAEPMRILKDNVWIKKQ